MNDNKKLLEEREQEIKMHKLIIPLSTSFSFILGYYLLHNPIKFHFLDEKAIYILIELSISFILIIYSVLPPKSKFKLDHITGIILCMVFSLSICMLLFTKTYFYFFEII